MSRATRRMTLWIGLIVTCLAGPVNGQAIDSPQTRLRPIDAPSAVDRYRPRAEEPTRPTARYREAAYQNGVSRGVGTSAIAGPAVRQAAWMQQFDAPPLPAGGGGFQLPSNDSAPVPSPSLPSSPASPPSLPPSATASPPASPSFAQPRALPSNPGAYQPVPRSSDLTPLAQPELSSGFATIGNCNCISAPSTYSAASGIGCGGPVTYAAPQAYVPPPTEIPAPAVLPNGFIPAESGAAPIRPLISFGQELNPVQLGQGIVGQPVAYVPGQPIRNVLRYIFP